MAIYLFASEFARPTAGNDKYMLAVGPNPGLGLSLTPVSDHSYETLDQLCDVIGNCKALKAADIEALRRSLDRGQPFVAAITEEGALCMGFKS